MNETVLQDIVDFCKKKLEVSDIAIEYLAKRNITKSSISGFEIGFCPTDVTELLRRVDPKRLREIGFIKDASFCWFTNYIIFPIRDQYNKLVAIAGRVLPQFFTGKRKYFNTFYLKGRVLYGLNHAIPFIRKTGEVLVSEGQLDTITAFQYNIKNLVSTCGTAFTFEHAMFLSRYAYRIKLLYDGDKAGQRAAQKVLEKKEDFKKVSLELALLTQGDDVDSYLNRYGVDSFQNRLVSSDFKSEVYDRFK